MKALSGILSMDLCEATKKAYDYFAVASPIRISDFKGIDSTGIVELVRYQNGLGFTATKDDELQSVMESLSNILISTVEDHIKISHKETTDPETWLEGFMALAKLFCYNLTINEETYNDKSAGQDVVDNVIRICFDMEDVSLSEGVKDKINSYLSTQAGLMKEMGFESKNSSNFTLIDIINFVDETTNIHHCCFRAYFSKFDVESIKVVESCEDPKKEFDFNFDVVRYEADFMLSNWENNPDFQKRVRDFIKTHEPEDDFFGDKTSCETSCVLKM